MENEDNSDEDQLKFDNELKKLKLRAENGATFFESGDLPTDVESQFLDQILAYEQGPHETKKIKDILGNPTLVPHHLLSDIEVSLARNKMDELLDEHEIGLDVIHEVDDREIYRFITEELIHEEIEIIHVDGMRACFIYEEYHPNEEEDLKEMALEFFNSMIKGDEEGMTFNLSSPVLHQAELHDPYILVEQIMEVMTHIEIEKFNSSFSNLQIDDEQASLRFEIKITTPSPQDSKSPTHTADFGFIREDEFWCINRFDMPSFGM